MFGVKLNQLFLTSSMKKTNFIVLDGQVAAQEFLVKFLDEEYQVVQIRFDY